MLKLHQEKVVRFVKVEQANAWVVLAFLVETEGGTIVNVSAPRIVRVIPKKDKVLALPGACGTQHPLLLPAPTLARVQNAINRTFAVVSPYFEGAELLSWFSARPPTAAHA